VHCDLNVLYTEVVETQVGNALGESLDQPDRLPPDKTNYILGKRSVVDRFGQVITRSCGTGVDSQANVNTKHLAGLAFMVEPAMVSART
jgi:hypothetical protein